MAVGCKHLHLAGTTIEVKTETSSIGQVQRERLMHLACLGGMEFQTEAEGASYAMLARHEHGRGNLFLRRVQLEGGRY